MKDLIRDHGRLDMDLLESCVEVLKPFKDVTVLMSSEISATAPLIKPLLSQLMGLSKPESDDPPSRHQATFYHDLEKR